MNSLMRRLASEGIGSAILFATVVGSGIMGERLASGNLAVALLANSLATGAVLFVLITMLGPVSGAHFNPAVTLALAWRSDKNWSEGVAYIIAQISCGVLGVWVAHAMFDLPIIQISSHARTGIGQWLGEVVATFGLVLTIIGTLLYKSSRVPTSMALCIIAAYWFTSSTSFANPAITIARSLTDSFAGIAPGDVLMFIASQLLGAGLGLICANFLFVQNQEY
jgi:glycerol uptake facilitator-like aquaporin